MRPVNFVEDVMEDPQVLANEIPVALEHELAGPQTQVGPMMRMSASPLQAQGASPVLGRHTDELVASMGYSADEIKALRERGVIA